MRQYRAKLKKEVIGIDRQHYLMKIIHNYMNKKKDEQTALPSKYPQGYFKKKKCRHCGKSFAPKAPSELYCSDFCKDYAVTEAYYKRVYGLSLKEYLEMAEKQHFVCAICGKENFAMGANHTGGLLVDHDHRTGKVRGLLCHNCNRALGLFHDDVSTISSAIKYLERVTTIPKGSTPKQVEAVSTER